jgi:hypothetical protein
MITEREEFAGKTTNGESKLPNGKTMTRDNIIRMARESGDWNGQTAEFNDIGLERFAALVAAHEREKVAKWMVERGYATGHGDTIEDLLKEIDWQAAEREREACAKWVELTNEEIKSLPSWWPSYEDAPALIQLVKDVEAKLKEKNT